MGLRANSTWAVSRTTRWIRSNRTSTPRRSSVTHAPCAARSSTQRICCTVTYVTDDISGRVRRRRSGSHTRETVPLDHRLMPGPFWDCLQALKRQAVGSYYHRMSSDGRPTCRNPSMIWARCTLARRSRQVRSVSATSNGWISDQVWSRRRLSRPSASSRRRRTAPA